MKGQVFPRPFIGVQKLNSETVKGQSKWLDCRSNKKKDELKLTNSYLLDGARCISFLQNFKVCLHPSPVKDLFIFKTDFLF